LTDDSGYDSQPEAVKALRALYGSTPNFKRWINPDQISVMGANSSRKVTDEELERDFGAVRCEIDGCLQELEALPSGMVSVYVPPATAPVGAPVTSATLSVVPAPGAPPAPRQGFTSASFAQRTQESELRK
jgi:hypothetical protein